MDILELIFNALPEALGGMIAAGTLGVIAYFIRWWNNNRATKPGSILHNLPRPDYIEFVGRQNELQQVINGLTGRSYLISISGIGGIGKSALALEVSHRYLTHTVLDHGKKLQKKYYYDAIVWVSAKRYSLRVDGINTREQEIQFQDILNNIAIVLGEESITAEAQSKKKELIRKELTKQRVLLIIDNLETIDDEQFMEFLRELPEPSKAIITTRNQVSDTYSIHLPGLSKTDAFNLIDKEISSRALSLTSEQKERLYNRSGGVPLAIVWTIARMEYLDIDNVLTSMRMNDESFSYIAHFCFYEVVNSLKNKQSYHTLLAFSLFSNKVTREAIGFVTEFPPPLRDTTLAELEKLSLINKTAHHFWMLPLTRDFVTEELNLPENEQLREKLSHKFADYYSYIKIKKVEQTNSAIRAIHLAPDIRSILTWNDVIYDYLQANFRAMERGVKITRIFFTNRDVITDNEIMLPEVTKILSKQRDSGIRVKILYQEELNALNIPYPPDMIIFDQTEVHIHKGSGGWYTDVEIIEDTKAVNKWLTTFSHLEKYSHEWETEMEIDATDVPLH